LIKKTAVTLSEVNKILFVCKGNICRSPFAQYYSQKVFPKSIEISSSGYYSKIGRKCPKKAIKAAKEFGIQLENHRSTLVTEDLIKEAQVIYIFDEENRQILNSLFPFAKNKIFLLGSLNENSPKIISDPYSKEFFQYKITFKLISKYIDMLNNSL